jgi:hypothetical protein
MAHLTLAGLSEDGKRLVLVADDGVEHTLDVDDALRTALRGEPARTSQLEKTMDSALRPRDIQARIRAGESAEAVAQTAQSTVERIMPYAAPVLAERAHVAQRAQLSSVRRRSGETGARTLGDAVAAQLRSLHGDPTAVEWDSWRREDGRWTLTGVFSGPARSGTATFTCDVRGNFVTLEDDDARWLVGEQVAQPAPAGDDASGAPSAADEDLPPSPRRRLSSVPQDELPLGEDAIELVHDRPSSAEPTLDLPGAEPAQQPARQPEETPPAAEEPGEPDPPTEPEQPAAQDERPARRPARKGRGRASVPSWDEIMFGGGKSD